MQQFMDQHGHRLDKVTTMPLEGEGTIDRRVDKYVAIVSPMGPFSPVPDFTRTSWHERSGLRICICAHTQSHASRGRV